MPIRQKVIVIGTLRARVLPWFDGWHGSGSIQVSEVLYGPASPGWDLPYSYRSPLGDLRVWIAAPFRHPVRVGQLGIWFLRRAPNGTWEASLPEHFWDGWSPLEERAEWEDYIRRNKRP